MLSRNWNPLCNSGLNGPIIVMMAVSLIAVCACKHAPTENQTISQPPPASQNVTPAPGNNTSASTNTSVNTTLPSVNTTTPSGNTTVPTGNTSPGTPVTINNLGVLQANGYLTARFFSIVNLKFSGAPVTYPTEFTMPKVPIVWNGQSFTGHLEETGNGEDVVYQTAGNVSADGSVLVSLVYSKKIMRVVNTGSFYRITLSNLPVGSAANASQAGWGTFKGIGPDLQNYVTRIEYTDGPTSGGQITPQTTYDSTDWANANTKPVFSLSFQGQVNALALTPNFNVANVASTSAWSLGDKVGYILVTAKNWNSYYSTSPQGADFNNYNYLVASLGPKPNPGYSVDIVFIQQIGDEITVKLRLNQPQPGMVYPQVIVYPVAAVSLSKPDVGAYASMNVIFIDDTGKQLAATRTAF